MENDESIIFHSEAFAELEQAHTWYEEQAPGIGDVFFQEVQFAVARIHENLGIGLDGSFKVVPLPQVIPHNQQPRLNQLCHPYQPFIRLSHSSRPLSCMEITQKFSS